MKELIKAKKSLGQNFLTDKDVSRRIVESVSPQKGDLVIEIGPGTGAITRLLTRSAARVVAVEIDTRLVEELRGSISASDLEIVEADALELDWGKFLTERRQAGIERLRVRVVANLPYYISTPILQKLINRHDLIFDMTLMLQAEVVERITAAPGGRDYGYLSVLAQYYSEARKLFDVPPSAFRPAPKVQSSVVRLVMRKRPPVEVSSEEDFFALVRAAFAQRRKTILNNLKAAMTTLSFACSPETGLERAAIDPKRRAETLTLDEFALLFACCRQVKESDR